MTPFPVLPITRYTDKRSIRGIRWSSDDSKLLTEAHNSINYIDLKDNTLVTLIAENQHGSVGGGTGSALWVGPWIDRFGQHHTVSANTFEQCTALLGAATAGQLVVCGRCRRT